jgi:cell pole-organizing protein PopZ
MATASSVQREPSMEEILASIRRIIEDNDSGRKPAAEIDDLRQDLEPASNSNALPEPATEVEAFRAELRAAPEPKKPVTLAEVQAQVSAAAPATARTEKLAENGEEPRRPPLTLAEVGAQVAAEQAGGTQFQAAGTITPADRKTETVEAKSPEASAAIVADWKRDIAAAAESVKSSPAGAAVMAAGEPKPQFKEYRTDASDEPEIEISEDDLAEEPGFEAASTHRERTEEQDEIRAIRPALLSEHVGRQVAAAFGELSDAFAARSRRSFDEIAEDMLRPMLQDWLDNNLPTLVERLVREEIERVARGAQ